LASHAGIDVRINVSGRSRAVYSVGEPSITALEMQQVAATLGSGRLTQGKTVERFERELADFLEVPHVIACSSGTAALHLALVAAGIGAGDEVLVPDLTFVATANAVSYTGAKPVLVDIDPRSWEIDLNDAGKKVSGRTKAIIPVHLYGIPCDMHSMQHFAELHDLVVIEDAAEAFGTFTQGRACGTHGLCGAFSFYANKVITTGEGGAVVTHDDELASSLRFFRGQAQSPERRFWHAEIGFNYRMTDVHAAIGVAQMQRINGILDARKRVVSTYYDLLQDALKFPDFKGVTPWLMTGLLPESALFSRVEARLESHNIEVRPVFVPMHRLPMYDRPDAQFPRSSYVADNGISLPTYPTLNEEDVAYIASKIIEVLP
jgi:perosamine synthetase